MYKKHIAFEQTDQVKQTFESIHYQSKSFSVPQEYGSEQTTTVEQFTDWAPTKTVFFITIYQSSIVVNFLHCRATETSNKKVSPLRMAQTGETIAPEKHVRLKFHQSGPSRVVKLPPTGFANKNWTHLEVFFFYVLYEFDKIRCFH